MITLIAVGAALFVALRSLHAEAASAALAQTSQPLMFQLRAATLSGDLRQLIADLREQVAEDGVSVELVGADGRIVDLGGEPVSIVRFPVDPTAARGAVDTGTIAASDGSAYLYASTTLRNPNAAGPVRSLVLLQPDTSGAEALRDLTRTLPLVVLLVLLVGAPIAYLLSRSVTGPIRRLAAATVDLPAGDPHPAPARGADRGPRADRPVQRDGGRARATRGPRRRACWPTCATTCARR